jgi:hypothetical protein
MLVYLMQYLRGTVGKGIIFSGKSFDMHIFTYSDWAGDVLTRGSTTGYVVLAAGGPISWQSKLQMTVSTSSMQAEYQAIYAGMQEVVWLRGVMTELGLFFEPTRTFLRLLILSLSGSVDFSCNSIIGNGRIVLL